MTRFKELRRIERAIEHRDTNDLRWAQAYCEDPHSINQDQASTGVLAAPPEADYDALTED
jgi:hypothetical protein